MYKKFLAFSLVIFMVMGQLLIFANDSGAYPLESGESDSVMLDIPIEIFSTRPPNEDVLIELEDSELHLSNGVIQNNDTLQSCIENYFSQRGDAFDPPTIAPMTFAFEKTITVEKSEEVFVDEATRAVDILDFQERIDFKIINGESIAYIEDIRTIEPFKEDIQTFSMNTKDATLKIEMDVYEWIWLDYCYEGDVATDRCGYGVEHTIILDQIADGYKVVDDLYNEEDIFGISESEDVHEDTSSIEQNIENVATLVTTSVQSDSLTNGKQNAKGKVNYDVQAAIDYANTWVGKRFYVSGEVDKDGNEIHKQDSKTYNNSVYGHYSSIILALNSLK